MEKSREIIKDLPIKLVLLDLAVGDKAEFPVKRFNTVRVTASNLSLEVGWRYKTSVNREEGVIEVTRTE